MKDLKSAEVQAMSNDDIKKIKPSQGSRRLTLPLTSAA